MQLYNDYSPTPFDQHINMPECEDWYVLPINRPENTCDTLTEANFQAALALLAKADPTEELFQQHSFNHWAQPFTIILAHPSLSATVLEIEDHLESYPILDEDLFSQLELDDLEQSWRLWGRDEFGRLFQEYFECSDTLRNFFETHLETYHLSLLSEQNIYCELYDSDHLYSAIERLITGDDFNRTVAGKWIKEIRRLQRAL